MIIKKIKFVDYLIIITLIFIAIFFSVNLNDSNNPLLQDENIDVVELSKNNSCEIGRYNFFVQNVGNLNDYLIKYEPIDLEIFPEIKNITCLGKIKKVNIDEKEITIFLGANRYWFNIINLLLNSSLILLVLKKILHVDNKLYFLYFLLNFMNFNLFNSHISILKIIIPTEEPQSIDENYFINVLFIAYCLIKNKNRNLILVFFYILVFFIPDYLGLFAIVILLQKKDIFKLNTTLQDYSIYFLPIVFYFLRTVYSLNSYFDNLWMYSGQSLYHGRSRFYDLVWNYESMACINNPNLYKNDISKECRELYGGILDNYLYITSDPYQTAIYTMVLFHVALIYMYIKLVKDFPEYNLLLSLLFISPAINFLTFQGNLDLLFMIFTFFLLYSSKKLNILISLIIFALSLYKVHVIGGLFGLVLFGYFNNDKKNTIITGFLLLISSYFAFSLYLNESIVSNFGQLEFSFGLLFTANILNKFTGYGPNLIFVILITLLTLINQFIRKNNMLPKKNILEKYSLYEYFLLFWFFFTLLITNNSYRLPIFIFLIFKFIISDNKLLINATLIFFFLSVTPTTYFALEVLLISMKHISYFILTLLTLDFILIELKQLLPKLYKNEMI